jgi:hypothetical protein
MLGHDKLMNHYKTNFAMMQHHKYSLSDIENMIPWERYLFVDLLKDHIKKLEENRRDQALIQRRK